MSRARDWLRPGLLAATLLLVLILLGPWLAPGPSMTSVAQPYEPPSAALPLGTDSVGRDVLSRLLAGGQRLVLVAVLSTLATTVVGGLIGMTAALRPRLDGWLMRPVDALLALPPVLLVLVLGVGLGASTGAVVGAALLVGVPFTARIARAATLGVVARGHVEAALCRGERLGWVLRHEIVPNVAGPVLADLGIRFVTAVYIVATAGFLGLGGGSERPDWGRSISQQIGGADANPWAVAAPALALVLLVLVVNLSLDRAHRRHLGAGPA